MHSIEQLFRRPWRLILGLLLSGLACMVLCVSAGQYMALVQSRDAVENHYTTVGVLTNAYMVEEILVGDSVVVSYLDNQPPKVETYLQTLRQEQPDYVRSVQQSLLVSGYVPEAVPLNDYNENHVPVSYQASAVNQLYRNPYTYAMLQVELTQVGEIQSYLNVNNPAQGYALELTGIVKQTLSLQEAYPDPQGRTIHVTIRVGTVEEAESLNLQVGETYVLWGPEYEDSDAQLRRSIAQSVTSGPLDLDWDNLEETARTAQENGRAALYRDTDGSGIYLNEKEARMANACAMTVCLEPLVYRARLGLDEISIPPGITLTPAEYFQRYQTSGIVAWNGSGDDFLMQYPGTEVEQWLECAEINDHAFPILMLDELSAVASFAKNEAYIVEGRALTAADSGTQVCVLSQSLAVANGLALGDTITVQFYGEDQELQSQLTTFYQNQANPSAWYYSATQGFAGEALSFEIVGLYRQEEQWTLDTHSFTPNTIFVPVQNLPARTAKDVCGGVFTSVILENGTIEQMQAHATEAGFEKLFDYHDQGYTRIVTQLDGYEHVSQLVLAAGCVFWLCVLLVFLLLFPFRMGTDLRRMWELGTPERLLRSHILVSTLAILLPGLALGFAGSAVFSNWMVEQVVSASGYDFMLELSTGTLGWILLGQTVLLLPMVWGVSQYLIQRSDTHERN